MSKFKPRIIVTIVTDESKIEFSTVKGRETEIGLPSLGPTKEQMAIARKAIHDLMRSK